MTDTNDVSESLDAIVQSARIEGLIMARIAVAIMGAEILDNAEQLRAIDDAINQAIAEVEKGGL